MRGARVQPSAAWLLRREQMPSKMERAVALLGDAITRG